MLEFGVADETAWRVGLSCGGKIRVYRGAGRLMDPHLLKKLNAARRDRRPRSCSPILAMAATGWS
jgi:xanthine/CO dehydrogenase XdhC/CoxF family maturation factor